MCLVLRMRTFHESASRVYDPPPRDFAAAGREACFHKIQWRTKDRVPSNRTVVSARCTTSSQSMSQANTVFLNAAPTARSVAASLLWSRDAQPDSQSSPAWSFQMNC